MALYIHHHHPLPRPFLSISEPTVEVGVTYPSSVSSSRAKMLFFLGGEAFLQVNDQKPILVREGSLAILPHPCIQKYFNSTGKAARIHAYCLRFLSLTSRSRGSARSGNNYTQILRFLFASFKEPKILTNGITARMRQQLMLLRHEFEEKDAASPMMLFSLALSLTGETARQLETTNQSKTSPPGRRKARCLINAAQEYMARNLRERLTLEKIAWALNVSEEHLCRTFRREAGQTPREALRQLQLNEAKSWLINSSLDIQQISDQTGFSSPNMFCRFFRTHCGTTPSDYRHANRGQFRHYQQAGPARSPENSILEQLTTKGETNIFAPDGKFVTAKRKKSDKSTALTLNVHAE